MKLQIKIIAIICLCLFSNSIFATTPGQNFGECLTDNLNGKERKKLAKWIFFAMAAHPEISSFTEISSKNRKDSDQYIGNLITRLMTEDCPEEMKTASNSNPLAIEQAFELVGQVAMQEIMTNKNVLSSITSYGQYADQEKISKLLIE